MKLAYTAWDLQAGSNGRFILGLGTQVKGHNERRYSVKWESPGPKLRELIQALRAIWDCWQNGTRLDFTAVLLVHVHAAGIQPRQNRPPARADLRGGGQSVHVSLGR